MWANNLCNHRGFWDVKRKFRFFFLQQTVGHLHMCYLKSLHNLGCGVNKLKKKSCIAFCCVTACNIIYPSSKMKQSPAKAIQLPWIIKMTTKSLVQIHSNIFIERKKKCFNCLHCIKSMEFAVLILYMSNSKT